MEGKHYSVCPNLQRENPPGVYDSTITGDIKTGFDATLQCTINDGLFIPSTAEVFSHNDNNSTLVFAKKMENDSIHDFTGITCVKPISSQPPGEISAVLKALPIELTDSLRKTFNSDNLDTCFKPIQQRPCSITQAPQTLDWSIYTKGYSTAGEIISVDSTDDCQSEQSSCMNFDIENTNILDDSVVFARKYFTHRQESIQSDVHVTEQTSPTQPGTGKWLVKAMPIVSSIQKSHRTSCKADITLQKSPSKLFQDPIIPLQLDNLYSGRVSDEILIEQHTLREGEEIDWEEQQTHLDWIVMLRKTFLTLRKDPNATKQQLRTIKHRLAKGLGRDKWNRSDYYPTTHSVDEPYDSDCSDSTYSSITVTSYASVVERHNASPSRIILDAPCTNYNFFGDDPPLFCLGSTHNNITTGSNISSGNEFPNEKIDRKNDVDEFEFIGGNNFMHIKAYGWLKMLPQDTTSPLSHVPPYHQLYYEMRNNFIVLYYDNKFSVKSRLYKPCKIKQVGWLISKFNKKYIYKKMNNLKHNETIYDDRVKLFHFGDAGRGKDVKHLLFRESFTPICAIHLKGHYNFESRNVGKLQQLHIDAQSIPLNKILWTRLKEADDDFFPAASFELPKSIEKTFSKLKFRKKLYKSMVDNVKNMIFKSQSITLSVLSVSHMENEDLLSKAVSRKRASDIINHLNDIKVPVFQHLSHFYNCPYLRELSLANIKFDEKFDRHIFKTSVKARPLNMLDYRFRHITDSDLDIIIDYLTCSVEWLDLSNNNLMVGDKLDKLVEKGNIKWLTLDANPLPNVIVERYKGNLLTPSNRNKPNEINPKIELLESVQAQTSHNNCAPGRYACEAESGPVHMAKDLYFVQMRDRFLDVLNFQGICNRSKIYSGRLASFQWGLVMFGKTNQLVLRSDFGKRIPENLLPLHYVYFELRGSYLIWFPNPLNKCGKKQKKRYSFQENYSENVNISIRNVFYILDCAVVKRAGFKWLKVKATKPCKCIDEGDSNAPFYLYLRGPSDSVTHTWMTFMAKLIAGQLYINTCDKHAILPSRAILDHCWQPWSQRLLLYGYPQDYESLVKFMSKLRRSLRLKYLNGSNMKFDGHTEFKPFEQIKLMQLDLSFNNFSMADEGQWDNVIDFCTKDVMAKEFIMDGNPLGDNFGTAKFLHKAITSLTANFIKFNYVEIGDAAGNQLCNLFTDSYDSIGYVKVIELKGHNMTNPVLEKLLTILKSRCPNLEKVTLTSSIGRHVKITNDVLEIMDTNVERCDSSEMTLQIVGQCVHHRRVKKGKGTTRHANNS